MQTLEDMNHNIIWEHNDFNGILLTKLKIIINLIILNSMLNKGSKRKYPMNHAACFEVVRSIGDFEICMREFASNKNLLSVPFLR